MGLVDVSGTAAALPEAWSSLPLGRVGTACVKVLRMDGQPVEEEVHACAEALFVVDGRLELEVEGAPVPVGAGEAYWVDAGVRHAVRAGSHGTLVIVEAVESD